MTVSGWIGVDLDGTLAYYDGWKGESHIGDPVPEMLDRVKKWLADGVEVRIFTARVGVGNGFSSVSGFSDTLEFANKQTEYIQDWCEKYVGVRLKVTAQKDFAMVELWDDRCVQVIPNTGRPVTE